MKKFFSMMAVLTAMFAFVACGEEESVDGPNRPDDTTKDQLATPVLSETHTETSITVSWDAVEGADSYMVNFNPKNYTTEELSYTFENLNAGEYTVRVRAKGEGYKDSETAKIVVSITGPTSVDWFTQTVANVEDNTELSDGSVVMSYNAVSFTWVGTGVTDLRYGMYASSDLEGVSDSEIKSALSSLDASILDMVNADGYEGIFNGLKGSTTYTLCTLVTNADGVEFLAKNEVTTAEAVQTEGLKRWLGSFSGTTMKSVDIKTDTIADETTTFTFTVAANEGTADEVFIDGLSNMGPGAGIVGWGYVVSEEGIDYLCVMACEIFAELGEGWYGMWIPYCLTDGGEHTFVTGSFPGLVFAMNAEGAIEFIPGSGELNGGATFTVEAMDALGYNEAGELGILQDADGVEFSVWKYGAISNISKVGAEAAALNAQAKSLSVKSLLPASVVVAK